MTVGQHSDNLQPILRPEIFGGGGTFVIHRLLDGILEYGRCMWLMRFASLQYSRVTLARVMGIRRPSTQRCTLVTSECFNIRGIFERELTQSALLAVDDFDAASFKREAVSLPFHLMDKQTTLSL